MSDEERLARIALAAWRSRETRGCPAWSPSSGRSGSMPTSPPNGTWAGSSPMSPRGSETLDPARDLELAARLGIRFVIPGDEEWPPRSTTWSLSAGPGAGRAAAGPVGEGAATPARARGAGGGGRLPVGHHVRRGPRRRAGRRARPSRARRRVGCRVRHRPGRPSGLPRHGRTDGGRARLRRRPRLSHRPQELLDHLAGTGAVVSERAPGAPPPGCGSCRATD